MVSKRIEGIYFKTGVETNLQPSSSKYVTLYKAALGSVIVHQKSYLVRRSGLHR
jgi:hypothetical protein